MKVIQLHKNESLLIKKAIKSNREAQQVLYDLHAPKMLSICRYYIKDLQHAEEAMLNGFFKVFSNLKAFKKEGSFEAWIRRIMVREAISFLRTQKKVEFPVEEVDLKTEFTNNIKTNIEVEEIQQLMEKLYNTTTGVVDANLLLESVEQDLDESFRNKVFDALKANYNKVKTAVAQRNE